MRIERLLDPTHQLDARNVRAPRVDACFQRRRAARRTRPSRRQPGASPATSSANCSSDCVRRSAAIETQHRDPVADVRQHRQLEPAARRFVFETRQQLGSRDGKTLSRHPTTYDGGRRVVTSPASLARQRRKPAGCRVASQTRTSRPLHCSRTRSTCTAISSSSPPQPTTTAGPSRPQPTRRRAVDHVDRQRRQRCRQQRQRRRDRRCRRRRRNDDGCLTLRERPHLEGGFDDDPERAVRSGEQLHQIVAGDVLHDPPAALHQRAVGEHHGDADEQVAHLALRQAQRPRRIGGDQSADRRRSGCGGSNGRCWPARLQQRIELCQRHAGFDAHRHVGGLVRQDPLQPARRQRHIVAPRRTTDREPRAVADGNQGAVSRADRGDAAAQLVDRRR